MSDTNGRAEKAGKSRKKSHTPPAASKTTEDDPFGPRGNELDPPTELQWVWTEHLAFGTCAECSGPKGVGKSCLFCALAADVTGGPRMDRGKRPRVPRPVLWFAGEENIVGETRGKLLAAGASLDWIRFPGRNAQGSITKRWALPHDFPELVEGVRQIQPGLIVLDPWSSCLPTGANASDPTTCRAIMEGLAALARRSGALVMVGRNFRKDRSGAAETHGIGSSEVTNVSRTCLQLRPHPDRSRWYVAVVTSTNLCRPPDPTAYRLVDAGTGSPKIEWGEVLAMTADELAEQEISSASRDERRDAVKLLESRLTGHAVPATSIIQEAGKAGIGERTLRKAKAELHVPSRRVCNEEHVHWEWGPLPTIAEEEGGP